MIFRAYQICQSIYYKVFKKYFLFRLPKVFSATGRSVFLLAANPLQCDCSLEWVRGAAGASVADLEQLRCVEDGAGEGGGVAVVGGAAPFLCHYTSHCFSLCRCCTFLACDCRMSCPDPCSCSHDQVSTAALQQRQLLRY